MVLVGLVTGRVSFDGQSVALVPAVAIGVDGEGRSDEFLSHMANEDANGKWRADGKFGCCEGRWMFVEEKLEHAPLGRGKAGGGSILAAHGMAERIDVFGEAGIADSFELRQGAE